LRQNCSPTCRSPILATPIVANGCWLVTSPGTWRSAWRTGQPVFSRLASRHAATVCGTDRHLAAAGQSDGIKPPACARNMTARCQRGRRGRAAVRDGSPRGSRHGLAPGGGGDHRPVDFAGWLPHTKLAGSNRPLKSRRRVYTAHEDASYMGDDEAGRSARQGG
jgi:hypothetical protein